MKKPMVFVLICLVWGWTPSSGTTVISPAAELGKCSTRLSLLQGAGLAPEPLALTRAFVSWGWASIAAADVEGAGGLGVPSLPSQLPPLSHPFGLWSCLPPPTIPVAECRVGMREGDSPGVGRAEEKGWPSL